jgi:eukaryotic-like serine/threonine-protein kinase
LRLVPGQDVANLWVSQPWSQTDTLNQDTTARIGAALNSDYLVLGAYTTTGTPNRQQIRLDVRLQDSMHGEILAEIAEVGTTQDLFRLVSKVGARLRERLGVPELAGSDQAGVSASIPTDPDAARFYALGLERLRQFDALAAKNLLEQGTQADPKFPLAHAMLARAWSALGYEGNRRQEVKKALDLSAGLPRAEQLLIEGDYQEANGNHDKAASAYSALFQLFPDDLEYGLQLAATQKAGAHESEARATLQRLRKLPTAASDDARIDLAEARLTRDESAALELVRNAISKALVQDKKLVAAESRKQQCAIMIYGAHQKEAEPVCEDAYNTLLGAGNGLGAADSLRLIGDLQSGQGHSQRALQTYQRALLMLRKLGEQEKTGAVLNNMALVYLNEGQLERAEQFFREALADFRQAGDEPNELTALANMADVRFLRGDLPGAGRLYQQGLERGASLDASNVGYFLTRTADLQLTQGLPKEALESSKRALAELPLGASHYRERTAAVMSHAGALEATADLVGARKELEETLALRQKLGESDLVDETQLAVAELLISEGHPERVEALITPILPELEKEKSDPASAEAYVTLSRADLAMGKVADAGAAISHAAKFAAAISDPAVRLPIAVQHARVTVAKVHGSSEELPKARQELSSVLATARRLGYYQIELQARQALAELEARTDLAMALSHLNALIAESRGRSLELAARQSEEVLARLNQSIPASKPGN